MNNQMLNYFGESHADYIHARGRLATNKLIQLLNPKIDQKILEIGFGTGSTLVELASRFKGNQFFGVDLSDLMFTKASKRIRFAGLSSRIEVSVLEKKNVFPFSRDTFDKIYAESILAIQEGDDFEAIFLEIQRVLKPNGELIFNETFWLDSTTVELAKKINNNCKTSFGIIQSNHDYPHRSDWKKLLENIGFQYQLEFPVSELSLENNKRKVSIHLCKSRVYTILGKTKALFSKSMRKEWKNYSDDVSEIMDTGTQLMEGVIVKVINVKKG